MGSMFPYSSMSAYLHHLSSSSTSNVTTNTQGVVGSPFWGVSDHEMHQAMGTNVNSSSIMSSHITNSALVPPSSFQMAREGQIFSQLSMETQMYFHCDGEMEEEGIVDMEKLQNWVPPTGSIPEYNEEEKEKEKGCMKKGGVNSEGDEKREERGTKGMMAAPPRRIVSKTARDSPDSSYSSVSKRQRCALIIQSQQQQQEEKEEERGNADMSSPLDENKTRTPSVSRRPSKDTKRSIITRAIDDQTRDVVHVRARRGQATDSHSLAERVRREKISQRMRLLQDLVPGCTKIIGKAMMLDEIINYVQCLQNQVEFLSMKLAELSPKINFDIDGLIIGEVLSNTYNNNNMDTATTYKSSSSSSSNNSSTSGGQVVVQGNMCAITYDPVCSNTMSSQSLLQTPLPFNGIFPPHQNSSVPLHAYNWQGFGI